MHNRPDTFCTQLNRDLLTNKEMKFDDLLVIINIVCKSPI